MCLQAPVNVNDMTIGSNRYNERIGLLSLTSVVGGAMELPAIPFARHQRIVFDDGLFEHGHVALTGLNGGSDHRLVLLGRGVTAIAAAVGL